MSLQRAWDTGRVHYWIAWVSLANVALWAVVLRPWVLVSLSAALLCFGIARAKAVPPTAIQSAPEPEAEPEAEPDLRLADALDRAWDVPLPRDARRYLGRLIGKTDDECEYWEGPLVVSYQFDREPPPALAWNDRIDPYDRLKGDPGRGTPLLPGQPSFYGPPAPAHRCEVNGCDRFTLANEPMCLRHRWATA